MLLLLCCILSTTHKLLCSLHDPKSLSDESFLGPSGMGMLSRIRPYMIVKRIKYFMGNIYYIACQKANKSYCYIFTPPEDDSIWASHQHPVLWAAQVVASPPVLNPTVSFSKVKKDLTSSLLFCTPSPSASKYKVYECT